jgi:putative ABC transport system permease protein
LSAIEERLNPLYPPILQGWQADVELFNDAASGYVRRPMWLMFGAVVAVLLISCGNVAGLLIARAAARVHEMGVRAALGASRARLMRQMLTESLLLAAAGGALGIAVACGVMRLALAWNPGDIPRIEEASLDLRVLAFSMAATFASGILFGLAPAFAASRVNLVDLMKLGGGKGVVGSSKRLGNVLAVAQMALTVVLLSGAGLLLRSYAKVAALDKGFSPTTVAASIGLDEKYRQLGKMMDFTNRLLTEVRALPGVEAAGAVTSLPLSKRFTVTILNVKGYAGETPQAADNYSITPGYFDAMRIRAIAGRMLDASDMTAESGSERNAERNVVVNEAFAKRFFAGRDTVGGLIRPADAPQIPWWHIVGIVADVRHSDLESAPRPTVYMSFNGGINGPSLYLAARGTGDFRAALRDTVKKLDPAVPVAINTMDEKIDEANRGRKFQTAILAAFAGSALALALVGLYGLTAYNVRRRTAEIGIRMALGATPARILRMVVGHGLLLAAMGLAIGLAGAAAASRVIASMLFGVTATDPATFVAVPALLVAVAAAACALPARRAAELEPSEALRHE